MRQKPQNVVLRHRIVTVTPTTQKLLHRSKNANEVGPYLQTCTVTERHSQGGFQPLGWWLFVTVILLGGRLLRYDGNGEQEMGCDRPLAHAQQPACSTVAFLRRGPHGKPVLFHRIPYPIVMQVMSIKRPLKYPCRSYVALANGLGVGLKHEQKP